MTVAYDGGAFFGWQDNLQQRSVEAELRKVLEKILQQPIRLQAASRTDVGVHAEGQIVNFLIDLPQIDLPALQYSINSLVPEDIVVTSLWEAAADFHPTLNSIRKEYHYLLCSCEVQLPLRRHFEWHYFCVLDIERVRQAAQALVGTHNFQAFCNQRKGLNYTDYRRTLFRLDCIELSDQCYRFELEGDAFLYKMARNIMGALVYVGCGRMTLTELSELLVHGDRTLGAVTAPAHGLTLKRVFLKETL